MYATTASQTITAPVKRQHALPAIVLIEAQFKENVHVKQDHFYYM